MSSAPWSVAWADVRSQWQGSLRLRVGVWVVIGICWLYGLLVSGDGIDAWRQAAVSTQAEIDRLKPLTKTQVWPAREADAQSALTTLRALQWGDDAGAVGGRADPALMEAALQDWARGTAAKAGLRIRDLTVARVAATGGAGAAVNSGVAASGEVLTPAVLRLRLTAELGRTELLLFLAEAARHERVLLVERLLVKPALPVGTVEIDLRAVLRGGSVTASAAPASAAGAQR